MGELKETISEIISTFGVAFVISLIVVLLGFFIVKIRNSDYSDQEGTKNFKNPFLAFSLLAIVFLAVVAVIVGFYYYANI
ncbi:MAG TPA: hypothetical protein VGA67_04240 [Candidatus Dojkabacteria bacterium]|jgi:heme/copper-type cytochrome/quinol oxidase subunit 2